ncbi:hypothetical protein H2200_001051 [Cladophialophora chaetospira]|uniref:MFS-type transporter n=1 Tax=Cladophialophora chaetospira TaxID=386627 RepID=A0AA39CP77_9EURO|nr:hypothetical protein H2200_001051 [Cladophialophora chaetospira]
MGLRTLREIGHVEKAVQLLGTADLGDVDHRAHVEGTNILLVPQPSSDMNDPLRWSTLQKYAAFLNVCVFSATTTGFVGGFAPALYELSVEFNQSLTKTTGLILWALFISGIGNFFWVPLGVYFGKRPIFVLSAFILFVSTIWCAVSNTFGSILASRIVGAFAGSSTEALAVAMIDDIFYLHERGSKTGLYIMFIYSGNSIGPLVAGFIVQGLNLVGIFLFVHESRFDRRTQSSAPLEHGVQSEETEGAEKYAGAQTVERVPTVMNSSIGANTKRSFVKNLSLWSGTSDQSILSHSLRPWLLSVYPAVFWGTTIYALCLAWQIGSGTLTSFIFQLPPYNFSPGVNGLINIPAFVGNLLGSITGGYVTDVYVQYWARKHEGKFSPEARLVLLVVPAVIVPTGLLMFGFGAQRQLHWAVIYVGYGGINYVTCVASIAFTLVMDSYFEVAAEALLMINGGSKIIAWAFTYGFIPWTTSAGYERVFGTMAGLFLVWIAAAVPLYVFGPRIRNYTTTKMRVVFWDTTSHA